MKFTSLNSTLNTQKTDCLVVALGSDALTTPILKELNNLSDGLLERLIKRKDLKSTLGSITVINEPQGLTAERLLIVGTANNNRDNNSKGSKKSPEPALKPESHQRALQWLTPLATQLQKLPISTATIAVDTFFGETTENTNNAHPPLDAIWLAKQLAQQLVTTRYSYKAEQLSQKANTRNGLDKITLVTAKRGQMKPVVTAATIGAAVGEGMNLARQLGNLPGNICTPSYLAAQGRKLAKGCSKLTCKVLSEKQMSELGMGSLLSVTAGTEQPAKMVILEYKGSNDKPTVLVGKGVTFDSGGISLKPGASMDEMKYDMCGAASVFGTIHAIAESDQSVHVVGIIPTVENMPSGKATKPGDVVTSMSGQTIEILNTDAEGRLILCDALTYAERYKPKAVVDIATLTGACVMALGRHASGLLSNNDQLAANLEAAGTRSGDRVWRLPLWAEYDQQLSSNFADMANIGGREAGTITAACFLSRFTQKYHWAHLDIAGTAWVSGKQKGATGRPVPLLVEFLLENA